MLTFGSFCSGIGAPEAAWTPLGWLPRFFAEIEPFPCAVLARHFPGVPNFGDMTRIDPAALPDVDLWVAGTPCQAFSVAGLRRSLADDRGNLTLHFCKLIQERAPRIVDWENVPGVLSTKDNAFGCFLAGLVGAPEPLVSWRSSWTDAGMVVGPRRSAAWVVKDAQYFGLAQRRRRVFVVSFRAGDRANPGAVLFEPESLHRDSAPRREAGARVAGTFAPRTHGGGGFGTDFDSDGGVVAQPFTVSARLARNSDTSNQWGVKGDGLADCVNTDGPQSIGPVPFDTTQVTSKGNYSAPKPGDPCHPLAAGAHAPAVAFMQNQRDEVRLIGGDGDTVGALQAEPGMKQQNYIPQPIPIDMRQASRGATMTNNRGADACSGGAPGTGIGEPGDPSPSISQSHPPAVAFNWQTGGDMRLGYGETPTVLQCEQTPAVQQGMAVRRLTPRECERLQGFPDDWTAVEFRGNPAADGPRYRALGNSMAVSVVHWLGQRIALVLAAHDKAKKGGRREA